MGEQITVEVGIEDKSSKKASTIGKAFSNLKDKVKSLLNPIDLAIIAITGFGVALVKQFGKFADLETKMVNVGNLFGATRDEVNGLTTELIDLSRQTPQNLDDMATSLFDVVSAGVPAAESVEFLASASKLATAGVTSTAVAVDGLTSAMNAYSIEFTKADEVSDKFFAAQQKGKTTIAELSNNIGKVAPIASSAGVSLDELLGSVSALTLNGIKTSEAATQMKAALSNIIKPSKDAQDVAAALGLEFNTQALEANGLSGFLKNVQEKTGGNTDAMAKLFGSVEALNAVLALSKNNFAALDEVQKAVTESAGSTDEAYKQNLKTFNAQWQIIKNNIDALWSGLIRTLIPAVTAVLESFNNFFDVVNKGIGKIQKGWTAFKKFFKKNNEEMSDSTEENNDKQTKSDIKALEAKKKAEQKRLEAVKKNRSKEVEEILSKLNDEKAAETEKQETILEMFKSELAEKQALRDVDEAEQIAMLERLMAKEGIDTEERKKAQNELYGLKKELREKNEKEAETALEKQEKALKKQQEDQQRELEDLENSWGSFYSAIADVESVEDAFRAMGNGVKQFLTNQIIAWMATESAKATAAGLAAAIPTFGASLLAAAGQVAGIAATGATAISAINAIKFQEGGIVPGNSFTGDKVPAFVNSGELILNRRQQSNIGDRLFEVSNTPNSAIMSQNDVNNSAIIRKLDQIQKTLLLPQKMNIPANDLSKATFNRQKTLLRRGEISNRGRS